MRSKGVWCCPDGEGQVHGGGRVCVGPGCSVTHSAPAFLPRCVQRSKRSVFCPQGDNIYMDEIMCVKRHIANSQVQCELCILLCGWHILFIHLSRDTEVVVEKSMFNHFYSQFLPRHSFSAKLNQLVHNIPNPLQSHLRISPRYWEQKPPQNSI